MRTSKFLLKLWCFGLILIVFCYFFVDRATATFIHAHHWRQHLHALTKIVEWPPVMSGLSPLLFFLILLCRSHTKPLARWQKMFLLLSLSVMFTYLLKNDLKWVFSRYWPETWINNNLSWINNQAYGFRWFQGNIFQGMDATGSFPSGHSSIAFATFVPIALYYHRIRCFCLLLASLEAFSMVAFNYHFVSDVIAGICLGTTCALLCYRFLESKHL